MQVGDFGPVQASYTGLFNVGMSACGGYDLVLIFLALFRCLAVNRLTVDQWLVGPSSVLKMGRVNLKVSAFKT
jgi:hypothetical protein